MKNNNTTSPINGKVSDPTESTLIEVTMDENKNTTANHEKCILLIKQVPRKISKQLLEFLSQSPEIIQKQLNDLKSITDSSSSISIRKGEKQTTLNHPHTPEYYAKQLCLLSAETDKYGGVSVLTQRKHTYINENKTHTELVGGEENIKKIRSLLINFVRATKGLSFRDNTNLTTTEENEQIKQMYWWRPDTLGMNDLIKQYFGDSIDCLDPECYPWDSGNNIAVPMPNGERTLVLSAKKWGFSLSDDNDRMFRYVRLTLPQNP